MAAMASGVPLNRLGRPEEIAEAILFVASDKASYLSGALIPVNGFRSSIGIDLFGAHDSIYSWDYRAALPPFDLTFRVYN